MFQIETPEDTRHLNMIIYGDTGVGKTLLAGTAEDFEETAPTLIIDVDGGTITLSGKPGIHITRPRSWKDLQEIYDFFRHDNRKYKSVVVDTISELQKKISMGNILGELSDDSSYESLESTVTPTRADWMKTGEQMRKFIRAFRELAYLEDEDRRVHVVFTAHEHSDDKRNMVFPQLSGRLGPESGGFVDILARLSVVNVEEEEGIEERRHLLTAKYEDQHGNRYLAKNRGGKLGKQIWDPSIKDIVMPWSAPTDKEDEK